MTLNCIIISSPPTDRDLISAQKAVQTGDTRGNHNGTTLKKSHLNVASHADSTQQSIKKRQIVRRSKQTNTATNNPSKANS